MLIGATMNETDLPAFKEMLTGNNIMRIFPVDVQVTAGKTLKVLPGWDDMRFTYCRQVGAVPFVSTKIDGDRDGLTHVRGQLLAMPGWVTTLYVTDRHEPEGDVTAAQFTANFGAFLTMVDTLPAAIRARIRCGPVLTKTWIDKKSGGGGRFVYDPGTGDFLGYDAYVASGTAKAVVSPDTLPDPVAFLAPLKTYKHHPGDVRDRLIAEAGVVGMPADVDGSARAAFLWGLYRELRSWGPATTGWTFAGIIWWNSIGKATGEVAQIGQRRDFPLHLRTVPAPVARSGAATGAPSAVLLPGDPPKPVAAYNAIFQAENPPPDVTVSAGAAAGVPAPCTVTVAVRPDGPMVVVDVAVNGAPVSTTQIHT